MVSPRHQTRQMFYISDASDNSVQLQTSTAFSQVQKLPNTGSQNLITNKSYE